MWHSHRARTQRRLPCDTVDSTRWLNAKKKERTFRRRHKCLLTAKHLLLFFNVCASHSLTNFDTFSPLVLPDCSPHCLFNGVNISLLLNKWCKEVNSFIRKHYFHLSLTLFLFCSLCTWNLKHTAKRYTLPLCIMYSFLYQFQVEFFANFEYCLFLSSKLCQCMCNSPASTSITIPSLSLSLAMPRHHISLLFSSLHMTSVTE